jgi:hypothetical protein
VGFRIETVPGVTMAFVASYLSLEMRINLFQFSSVQDGNGIGTGTIHEKCLSYQRFVETIPTVSFDFDQLPVYLNDNSN